MKHLMRFENYTANDRSDEILDKISKYGMSSLSKTEKEFLDSFSKGDELNLHNKITKEENETVFNDDMGYFTFELDEMIEFDDETHYKGILYVPDLKLDEKTVDGRLEGSIISYEDGQTAIDFNSIEEINGDTIDVFEFCNGIEYELDSFVDYIISELDEE